MNLLKLKKIQDKVLVTVTELGKKKLQGDELLIDVLKNENHGSWEIVDKDLIDLESCVLSDSVLRNDKGDIRKISAVYWLPDITTQELLKSGVLEIQKA